MPLVIDTINSDERSKIGEALTIWIPSVTRGEDPMPISMGEILEIVNIHLQDIGPTGINKPDTKPLDPAYYVQLFSGRQARYFATVERTSNATEPWKVLSIFSAEVAAKVEVGMAWIDQLVSTPPVSVKLLQISSYLLTGLMLEWNDKTQVLLLDLPVSYDIPSFHLYSLKKIRDLLSKYPPSSGILISVPKPAPSETPLSKQP